MGRLTLKDGTAFDDSVVSLSVTNKSILCTIPGTDIVQYASLFGNPEKTQKITYKSGYYKDIYTGFTILESLNAVQDENHTVIGLGSPGEESIQRENAFPEEYLPESMRIKPEEETAELA